MVWILVVVLIVWIVVWIALRVLGVIRPTTTRKTSAEIEAELTLARERLDWTNERDIPGGLRNTCGIYTFPATSQLVPGQPTLDKAVLDALTPRRVSPLGIDCTDADQIAAKEQERTCLGTGTPNNTCISYNGQVFQQGQVETFYTSCDTSKCAGDLGLIAINFDSTGFPSNDTRCMSSQSGAVDAAICDLQDGSQVFRIERATPTKLTPSDTGPFARFIDRTTGRCVLPATTPTSGTGLVLGECDPNLGYVWFLAPSAEVVSGEIAPQQIVYTTDISTFPSPSEMEMYIQNNNPFSIALDDGSLVMREYTTEPSTEFPNTSQIINYRLYQLISSSTASGPNARFPFYNWS